MVPRVRCLLSCELNVVALAIFLCYIKKEFVLIPLVYVSRFMVNTNLNLSDRLPCRCHIFMLSHVSFPDSLCTM